MYQRHLFPPLGALRRSIPSDAPSKSACTTRGFHVSVRRCEDTPGNPVGIDIKAAMRGTTRRTRQNAAVQEIQNLQAKPGRPRSNSIRKEYVDGPAIPNRTAPPTRMVRGPSNPSSNPPGGAPGGTMIKAPSTLRFQRTLRGPTAPGQRRLGAERSPTGGPNLMSRRQNRGGANSNEQGPKPRFTRKTSSEKARGSKGEVDPGEVPTIQDTLSDGMVQHLLRLQRKEWDDMPYEPKYAHGSEAAKELVTLGKSLFEGEKPEIKKPGKLEKRLGIVGMHGA